MSGCRIAEKLTELRTSKGITQAKVADELGVSDKVISKWENGLSMPDLNMLIALADFYDVSTDTLLGVANDENKTIAQKLKAEFAELDCRQSFLKAFEVSRAMIPMMFGTFEAAYEVENNDANAESNEGVYLPETAQAPRNCISSPVFYNFTVNSDNANMAFMLLRNKNNFSWLKNSESQKKIAELFAFLSDPDVLSIIYFIHTESCPQNFTADYVAAKTGISEDKVTSILQASEQFQLCFRKTAHLVSGKMDIYESFGEGNILSLVTLAYEHTCGEHHYDYNFHTEKCSMIGGAKE